jgi:hypothetical protein
VEECGVMIIEFLIIFIAAIAGSLLGRFLADMER